MTVLAIVCPSVALVVSAVITAYFGRRLTTGVDNVHAEVKTMNGKTVGQLADQTEGRRVAADIPAEKQTASERAYVENLDTPPDHSS